MCVIWLWLRLSFFNPVRDDSDAGRLVNWLLARLNTSSLVHEPSSSGTSLSRLRYAKSTFRFLSRLISGGKLVSWFPQRLSTTRFCSEPKDAGTDRNALSDRLSFCSSDISHNSSGGSVRPRRARLSTLYPKCVVVYLRMRSTGRFSSGPALFLPDCVVSSSTELLDFFPPILALLLS